jgi:hypothetical protein
MPCCWLRHDLEMFPTLIGTGMISGPLKQSHPFYEPFSRQIASAKGKKGNPRGPYCFSMRSYHSYSSVGPKCPKVGKASSREK